MEVGSARFLAKSVKTLPVNLSKVIAMENNDCFAFTADGNTLRKFGLPSPVLMKR